MKHLKKILILVLLNVLILNGLTEMAIAQEAYLQNASAVTVGPDGDVVLFMKLLDVVLIKVCAPYSIVQKNDDCTPRDGTTVARVPVLKVKADLLVYLQNLYDSDGFEKEVAPTFDSVVAQKEQITKRISDFIQFYCGSLDLRSDCASKNANVQMLIQTTNELNKLKAYEPRLQFERSLIGKMVDEIIGVDPITTYRASDRQTSLFYRLLKGYTMGQNLPNTNNDPIQPVPPTVVQPKNL